MSTQCQICHRDLHEDPTNREGCLSCQLKAATMLNQILDLVCPPPNRLHKQR